MATNTTSQLSNSVRARYVEDYILGAMARRVYDQLAYPISEDRDVLERSSSVVVPFLTAMGISEQTISETVDITPQVLRDGTASLAKTSRADAIQDSEKLLLNAYTDYGSARFRVLGDNMIETLEAANMDTSLAGELRIATGARSTLDAGTSDDLLDSDEFSKAASMLMALRCPPLIEDIPTKEYAAIMPPEPYYDLITSGDVVDIAKYQSKEILLNEELGSYGRFRIVMSPFAKVFGGAGADNADVAATTLSSAVKAGATKIVVASDSNVTAGRFLTIGTEETSSTFYHENERVRVADSYSSGTTVDVVGMGPQGTIKFDHASGTAVRNADSVYPVLFGGPKSVAKAYASEVGEFGQVVGPKMDGLVDQFVSLGWKWYGGYGIINDNWLVRGEYASSHDA